MRKLLLISAFAAAVAFAGEWKGVISDSHCGAKHTAGGAETEKCVKGCVKSGGKPVLVSEGKVYKFADDAKVMEHLGHDVVITGKMDGETITVDQVTMAKK